MNIGHGNEMLQSIKLEHASIWNDVSTIIYIYRKCTQFHRQCGACLLQMTAVTVAADIPIFMYVLIKHGYNIQNTPDAILEGLISKISLWEIEGSQQCTYQNPLLKVLELPLNI